MKKPPKLVRKPLFTIRVNQAEFLKLPLRIRRRAGRDARAERKHTAFIEALDGDQ